MVQLQDPPALATVQDVMRVLRTDNAEDEARIQPILEATIEWVKTVFGDGPYQPSWDTPQGMVVTKSYYNVYDDSTVKLPDPNPSITKVQVFPNLYGLEDSIFTLNEVTWQPTLDGQVQILISDLIAVPYIEFVSQRTFRRIFRRVDITYIASGIIPANVREGVALIAAATYSQQDIDIRGLRSERIGGYSYEIGPNGMGLFVPLRARSMLRAVSRRRIARII